VFKQGRGKMISAGRRRTAAATSPVPPRRGASPEAAPSLGRGPQGSTHAEDAAESALPRLQAPERTPPYVLAPCPRCPAVLAPCPCCLFPGSLVRVEAHAYKESLLLPQCAGPYPGSSPPPADAQQSHRGEPQFRPTTSRSKPFLHLSSSPRSCPSRPLRTQARRAPALAVRWPVLTGAAKAARRSHSTPVQPIKSKPSAPLDPPPSSPGQERRRAHRNFPTRAGHRP
jgi:hypothetical protein